MKKIFSIFILLFILINANAGNKQIVVSEQTTIQENETFVVLITTDEKMIECINNTTEVYLTFSIITTNEDGTRTGKFYYRKERSAYVVTRAYSIQNF